MESSKRIKENQREWNRNGGIGGVGWMLIETDLETGQSSQIGGVFDADIGRVTSAGSVNIFGSFGGRWWFSYVSRHSGRDARWLACESSWLTDADCFALCFDRDLGEKHHRKLEENRSCSQEPSRQLEKLEQSGVPCQVLLEHGTAHRRWCACALGRAIAGPGRSLAAEPRLCP